MKRVTNHVFHLEGITKAIAASQGHGSLYALSESSDAGYRSVESCAAPQNPNIIGMTEADYSQRF